MTANAIGTAARTVALALVLAAAAAVGLVVGNALNGRADTNAGYPEGWQGGAAAPITRTARAAFSLDAIAAVQAARGDAKPAPYVDYALRHAGVERISKTDSGLPRQTNPDRISTNTGGI